jgi:hypothetical protein
MRAALLCLAAISLSAQRLPPAKPLEGFTFDANKLPKLPVFHFHPILLGGCKGKPDHVYGSSGSVYYACISEQDVCTTPNAHRGVGVPRALITQYQQVKAMLQAKREAGRARIERAGQERKARSGAAVRSVRGGSAPAVEAATVNRATTVPLADSKLEGIAVGAALSDVIEALGNPYSRITGESERLTYRLESGGVARLVFEGAVLKQIERPGR